MKDPRWGPLLSSEQILIHFQQTVSHKTQEEIMDSLEKAGGLFVHFIPPRSWLFLGGPHFISTVERMHPVVRLTFYDQPSDKLSPHWRPVLSAMKQHSLSVLKEKPLHQLTDSDSEHFFGSVHVDQASTVDRIIIEVGFPSFHKHQGKTISMSDGSYAPAQAAAVDWITPLRELYGSEIEFRPYHGLLDVYVPESAVEPVLELLSRQGSVHWLQPKSILRLHNWRASGIIQSGRAPVEENGIVDGAIHPIWAAGIQGEGQIVGCGDSGVDVDSCYFHDPEVPFHDNIQYPGDFLSIDAFFESDQHRKLRYYGGLADLEDSDGHGTHVAGTLLGNPPRGSDGVALANRGMAPEALLAFLDLGGGEHSSSESISTPRELSTFYYPITYSKGARIHSDSWGSESPTYDLLAAEVDKFVWEHQDFLPIFAAGNYGQLRNQFLTTVTSPATAKNCISVGATLTANQPTRFQNHRIDAYLIEVHFTDPNGQKVLRRFKILGAEFGASWSGLIKSTSENKLSLILGVPETGCSSVTSESRGKIVLLKRGDCKFVQKLINAQAKEAAGVFLMNDVNKGYFTMEETESTPDSEFTIPLASIPLAIGRVLIEAMESEYNLAIQIMERTVPEHAYDNIADFSSNGPTIDYRFKPDIVAPGQLKSVMSDGGLSDEGGQCRLRTSSGTSMATPVVAGAAVLVRQYFMDGFYPTGTKRVADRYQPSAALIKATLLGGAFAMDGYTETGVPLEPPPSARQGYGRVHLAASIPVANSEKWDAGWKLQVVDGANLTTGQSHEYCLHATGGEIRVTLVWTDPPADVSSWTALVNDLDLSVRSEGLKGRKLLGNGIVDRANNVERVSLDDMPEGNLAIVVAAHHTVANYGPQPYALVVHGLFNGILRSPHNPYQSDSQSSNQCIITLAVLGSGPEGATKESSPEFTFTTQSGVRPVNGFECRLTNANGTTSGAAALHDWIQCASPWQYTDLPDSEYVFVVRGKNEKVEVERVFIVDTEPPEARILGSPIEAESARESVRFEFDVDDLTPVTLSCKLETQGAKRGVRISRNKTLDSYVKLGDWFSCTSPEIFRGLAYGDWTFRVRGKDEAGNIQRRPAKWSWTVRYDSNQYYVRAIRAPFAITPSATVSFSLQAFTGGTRGQPKSLEDTPVECRLFPAWNQMESAFPFSPCSSDVEYKDNEDGLYGFEARTEDPRGHSPVSVSFVEFTIDTTSPLITFIQKPGSYHGTRDLDFVFTSNERVSSYSCSMRPRRAAKRFIQCPGTDPGSVGYQLDDGAYTFQVRARDLVGNQGASESVSFIVDTIPPQIFFRTLGQLNTNQSDVWFEFDVEDTGSGVVENNHTCSLLDEQTGIRYEAEPEACTSPIRYTLEEGRYLFTLRAADRAGGVSEEELPIVVDFTPPLIEWLTKPSTNDVLPALVVFQFQGSDEPKNTASLVTSFQCKLELFLTNKTLVETNTVQLTDQGNGRRLSWIRRLAQDGESEKQLSVQIRDGSRLEFDEWVACESPAVLTGLSSGRYGFQTRAIDNAGNIGKSTPIATFTVDDTLPIPGATAADAGHTTVSVSQSVSVALVVASVLFALLLCIVVGLWRRRSRRRRAEKIIARRSEPQPPPVGYTEQRNGSTGSSTQTMLETAIQASLREQQVDEQRRRQQQEAALYDHRLKVAMQQSQEQYDYQEALNRSLNEK